MGIPQILEALVAYVELGDAKKYSAAQCVLAQLADLVRANRPEIEAAIEKAVKRAG